MAASAAWCIELTTTPAPADRAVIDDGLGRFNEERTQGVMPSVPLVLLVTGGDPPVTRGGLWGSTAHQWLFVEMLFLPPDLRGGGLGTEILRRAEAEALARGCHGVWLDTFSFQARGFYERLGYGVFGQLDDYPAGHSRFFLRKRLAPADPG